MIDEAGMIGNEIMHSILKHANSKNMPRVVLLGDADQLPPITAGRPFKLLLDNGLRSVRMKDVVRQKSARHRQAVVEISQGKVREFFQTINKEVHEVPKDQLENYAVNLRQKMDDPSIIVNTNRQREAINQAIKSEIMSESQTGQGHVQKIWRPVYLSMAQRTKVGSYETASHIRFTRNVGKDFKKNEIYRITKVDHNRAELILKNRDGVKAFRPARHGSGKSFTQAYQQSEITLHVGDKVKFREADKKLGLSKNDYGEISSISGNKVVVLREDKSKITLPISHRLMRHLDHAWANTIHSFQGVTVKDNITIMKADQNPLTTLEALYVAGSRHKNNLAIITDDKQKLMRVISEKLEIVNEQIVFKDPSASEKSIETKPALPETIIENLERSRTNEPSKLNERDKSQDIKNQKTTEPEKEETKTEPIQRERERVKTRQRSRGDRGR